MYCSNEAKKNRFIINTVWLFLCFGGVKKLYNYFRSTAASTQTSGVLILSWYKEWYAGANENLLKGGSP